MKRNWKNYVSLKAVQHLAYLPPVATSVKNWPEFISNYLGFSSNCPVYRLRDGVSIKTNGVTDVATILDVYFRKDYGNASDNSVIIDIGANIGVYAIYAATKSQGSKIFAFEPAPAEFEMLTENIAANNLGGAIVATHAAVSGKNETRTLFLNGGPHNSIYEHWEHAQPIEVACVSLESIFEKNNIARCDMLKMDCEGSEFEIFQSAPDRLFEKIAAIRMEYHCGPDAPMTVEQLIAFLESKKYRIIKHEPGPDGRGIIWAERTEMGGQK
jgi:FkbM family methyltransferase